MFTLCSQRNPATASVRLKGVRERPVQEKLELLAHRLKTAQRVAIRSEIVLRAATHWSTRSLAEKVGLSQSAVARIWHSFGLQPHRTETFKLSTDPYLVEKVRDIVGLHLNPPEHAIVLCVDEKSQVQALNRTQPILPLRPGLPE
jgi:transcriptional regulator with XRE-family HTH domain